MVIDNWAMAWDFQQCGMCDQQSLRSACAYAQSDLSLLLVASIFYDCLAIDWTPFGVSKLKRRLQRLVWVNTCQNTTLLEISCHGSMHMGHPCDTPEDTTDTRKPVRHPIRAPRWASHSKLKAQISVSFCNATTMYIYNLFHVGTFAKTLVRICVTALTDKFTHA